LTVGLIVAEDDGWWRQVVDRSGRMWTVRVRTVRLAGIEYYECWVNNTLLPTHRRRDPSAEPACLEGVFAVGLQYIRGHEERPCCGR
jgi:hypothetical protein